MVRIYSRRYTSQKWEKVKFKEDAELYMDVQTGELRSENPDSEKEWGAYKSTTADKTAYYCMERKEWKGPATPREEKEEQGSVESKGETSEMKADNGFWKSNSFWKERWIGEVRVLYSYRRRKTVSQGDMEEAGRMLSILERVAHQHLEDGGKAKWAINTPEAYGEKTKGKRTKSKQTRKKPIKRFLDTMEMLKHEASKKTDTEEE